MHVTIQKRADVFTRRRNLMLVENTDDNTRIRHPRDFDAGEIIINAEALFKCMLQCFDSRASRMDQRAINIEEQKPLSCLCHLERSGDISYCSLANSQSTRDSRQISSSCWRLTRLPSIVVFAAPTSGEPPLNG